MSCDGFSPFADVRTSALASLSATVILPMLMLRVLDAREASLERDLAWEADLLELVDELRREDPVAERLVVLRRGRTAEVGQRLADLLLVGGAAPAAGDCKADQEGEGDGARHQSMS